MEASFSVQQLNLESAIFHKQNQRITRRKNGYLDKKERNYLKIVLVNS